MPREIVLGNGELLVNLDQNLEIRDIYFPYVGWANHVGGHRCRLGVWTAEAGLSWLSDPGWDRQLAYTENSLQSDCTFRHAGQRLRLHITQAVHARSNILLQSIRIESLADEDREVRVFFAPDLRIDESDIGDTCFYHPWLQAMIHYKRDRFFLFGGQAASREASTDPHIWQYACGEKGFRGAEGTWRDAEDGFLSMNAIAQGSVDSVISWRLSLPGRGTAKLHAWMAAHESLEEVGGLQGELLKRGFDKMMAETVARWNAYVSLADPVLQTAELMPPKVMKLFSQSLLIIRAHADRRGAIIASNDSDIMETARAHYSYMWPRDGALIAAAMDEIGDREISRSFFEFCARVLPKDRAALMHKYGPDGTLGASWHPWIVDGEPEIPFQEDGTALTLWALNQRGLRHQDDEFTSLMYRRFTRPCAKFLIDFRDRETHLPLPSWDVWEERRDCHLWTCCAVIAGMSAAADMARRLSDLEFAELCQAAASETREAVLNSFWDPEKGWFARRVSKDDKGNLVRDMTVDSSLAALFLFGVLPADDPKVASAMAAVGRKLWVKAGSGGLARYERDYYFRVSEDFERIPGNPWIICTLWLAEWYIATAQSAADLRSAMDLLEWACRCASSTQILPEQTHPDTLAPLSVAPLTWSHAQFVSTVAKYAAKLRELRAPAAP